MSTSATTLESPAVLKENFEALAGRGGIGASLSPQSDSVLAQTLSPGSMNAIIIDTLKRNGIDPSGVPPQDMQTTAGVMSQGMQEGIAAARQELGGTIDASNAAEAGRIAGSYVHNAMVRNAPAMGYFGRPQWINTFSGVDNDFKLTDPLTLNAAGLSSNIFMAARGTSAGKSAYHAQLEQAGQEDSAERFAATRPVAVRPDGARGIVGMALSTMDRKLPLPDSQGQEYISGIVANEYAESTPTYGGASGGGMTGMFGNLMSGLGKNWPWLAVGGVLGSFLGPMLGMSGIGAIILGMIGTCMLASFTGNADFGLGNIGGLGGGGDRISGVRERILASTPEQLGYPDIERFRNAVPIEPQPDQFRSQQDYRVELQRFRQFQQAVENAPPLAPGERPQNQAQAAKYEIERFSFWREEVASRVSGQYQIPDGPVVDFSRGDARSTGLTAMAHGLDPDGTEVGRSDKLVQDLKAIQPLLDAGKISTTPDGALSFAPRPTTQQQR